MKVEILYAQPGHLVGCEIPADWGAIGEPRPAVLKAFRESFRAWTGFGDGQPFAFWGVYMGSLFSDTGYIWLTPTTLARERPLVFARHSRWALQVTLGQFEKLYGFVLNEHEPSKRWLRWMGFTVDEGSEPVCRFHRSAAWVQK